MKQICHPSELYKALKQANLLDYIQDIQGENQQQHDGVWLPACEIVFKPDITPQNQEAINTVFATQIARDWRAWILSEKLRLEAVDASIQNGIIGNIATMTNAEYDIWWDARTPAQKDLILKRILRVICRRVL